MLGLIRLKFAVQQGKIGGTTSDVSDAAESRQTEIVRVGARRDADKRGPVEELSVPPGDLTFVTVLTL